MSNSFNETPYGQTALDRLIIYAMRDILILGEECTFERLVKECFTSFPKSFRMYRYPEWPDSNKLDRPLRKLREKGWIVGNPKTGFSLTSFGERVAAEVERELTGGKLLEQVVRRPLKGRERILIDYLKESDTYKRFLRARQAFAPTEAEVRAMLRCTLETPIYIVKQNLVSAKKLAEDCDERELSEFLNECEERIPLKS